MFKYIKNCFLGIIIKFDKNILVNIIDIFKKYIIFGIFRYKVISNIFLLKYKIMVFN